MNNEPLVSVIIPAYNSERYIGDALESVLKQTYSNWEVIVVDDGSKDGTADVVKKYAARESRIQYVFQENQRMAAARNKGIAMAKGKYIAFLDNDDLFRSEKLSTQVAYMGSHPECGVSYGRILHFFDGAPEVLYQNPNEKPIDGDAFRSLLWRNSINVLQVLVRKELFDHWGAFQGKWPACDEQYVWVNLARHDTQFHFIDTVVGLYREHRSSDSRRNGHIFDTAESFLKMLNLIEPTLSAAERAMYQADFDALRKKYHKMLFIGRLMKTAPFSWVLVPLYLRRRGRHFVVPS